MNYLMYSHNWVNKSSSEGKRRILQIKTKAHSVKSTMYSLMFILSWLSLREHFSSLLKLHNAPLMYRCTFQTSFENASCQYFRYEYFSFYRSASSLQNKIKSDTWLNEITGCSVQNQPHDGDRVLHSGWSTGVNN